MSELNIRELKFTNLVIDLFKNMKENNLSQVKTLTEQLNSNFSDKDFYYFRDLFVNQDKDFYNESFLYVINNLICYRNNTEDTDIVFQGYLNYLVHRGETPEININSLIEGLKNNTYNIEAISGAILDNFISFIIRYGDIEKINDIQELIVEKIQEK